jgi:transcription elongation factor GreA
MDVLKKLQEELSALDYEMKHKLPLMIREAASHGDLSENAEYEAAKQRQQWVSARMGHLRQRMQSLSLVDLKKMPTDRAAFGSTVTLESVESGETKTYRLVHPEEVDASKGLISVQSPVGQALTGKQEGDEVVIRTPAGAKEYVVSKLVTIHDTEE